jgi:metal-dependent amidase/aminoacylase/carboxypeptidase family protein
MLFLCDKSEAGHGSDARPMVRDGVFTGMDMQFAIDAPALFVEGVDDNVDGALRHE